MPAKPTPRVLVVDDEPSIVDAVATSLRYEGFEVESVTSGRPALAAAQENAPDLIILDVMLPDINGQAVCELIKQDQTMKDIRIICISGMVEEDKIDELRASGADDFLHKPVDIDELIRRVCRLLEIEPATSA